MSDQTVYITAIPEGEGGKSSEAATSKPKHTSDSPEVGYSERFAREDHIHASWVSQVHDPETNGFYSQAHFGYSGDEMIATPVRFHGWGLSVGEKDKEGKYSLEYCPNSHFKTEFFITSRNNSDSSQYDFTSAHFDFNQNNMSLFRGSNDEGWKSGNNNGTRVFESNERVTELSVTDYNNGSQRKILSAGVNYANDTYTILNGAYSSVQDPFNPDANAHPLLKVGTYNGGYSMLYGKNGKPLLGSAGSYGYSGRIQGLFNYDGNLLFDLGHTDHRATFKQQVAFTNLSALESDTRIAGCGFTYTASPNYKPSVALQNCAVVNVGFNDANNLNIGDNDDNYSAQNDYEAAQIMIEKRTGRIFLRYVNNSAKIAFKEVQTTDL